MFDAPRDVVYTTILQTTLKSLLNFIVTIFLLNVYFTTKLQQFL